MGCLCCMWKWDVGVRCGNRKFKWKDEVKRLKGLSSEI
jgi:hypothetical protein